MHCVNGSVSKKSFHRCLLMGLLTLSQPKDRIERKREVFGKEERERVCVNDLTASSLKALKIRDRVVSRPSFC